jgi:hypothetical protein
MSSYFRFVPNIDYINRTRDSATDINQFITTKNLFKRVKLRSDIFANINFFTKYQIIGDERPDNVAFKVYGDEILDWVILLSNNILNIQTEWPLTQTSFDKYLNEKYGSGIDNLDEIYNIIFNGVHHYETIEVKDSRGVIQLKEGIVFTPSYADDSTTERFPTFKIEYFDPIIGAKVTKEREKIFRAVTNYEYESKIENDKRSIFALKPQYLNVILNDIEKVLPYVEGSSQYISPFLKRVDDIRLYQ